MKHILRFIFVCAACLSQQTNLLAQGKLVDGFIITNQNDTVRGLIKDETGFPALSG